MTNVIIERSKVCDIDVPRRRVLSPLDGIECCRRVLGSLARREAQVSVKSWMSWLITIYRSSVVISARTIRIDSAGCSITGRGSAFFVSPASYRRVGLIGINAALHQRALDHRDSDRRKRDQLGFRRDDDDDAYPGRAGHDAGQRLQSDAFQRRSGADPDVSDGGRPQTMAVFPRARGFRGVPPPIAQVQSCSTPTP